VVSNPTGGFHTFSLPLTVAGQVTRCAIRWDGTDLTLFVNGYRVSVAETDGWSFFPEFRIGGDHITNSDGCDLNLKGFVQYSSALNDRQLAYMTTYGVDYL